LRQLIPACGGWREGNYMTSILGGPAAAPTSDAPTFLEDPNGASEPTGEAGRRLVVRLVGGEELELGEFEHRGDAVEAAQELVVRFSSAEASGEWPEIEGRFLRPASVTSIDVLIRS
jgi:hypothetical protein